MDQAASDTVYQFEGFVLDLGRGTLLHPKQAEVPLRAKSFDLLCLFLTNAGRLLDRDTINQAIWPDVVVTDDAITQCVRDIRRALDDEQQRILKTVRRRGYIFDAKVTIKGEQRLAVSAVEALPLPDKPSIAVLAFTNMSGDQEQEYFSDGIADEIITELSRSRALFVIARNSSFTYKGRAVDIKQVAGELGVRYVLEGSVRRSGGRVRVIAQLIDAGTGNHIWADRYDRAVEDVFTVQDQVATAVITAILPAVMDAEQRRALRKPPENLGAWEAYQRGLWHLGQFVPRTDNEQARSFFRNSVAIDPMFAPACSALAQTYMREATTYGIRQSDDLLRSAEGWARRAVDSDHGDAEAQATLARAVSMTGNHNEGRQRAALALQLNPNSAWAHYAMADALLFSGSPTEARAALIMAQRLNPRGPFAPNFMILTIISYYLERDYEKAAAAARRAVASYPALQQSYRWVAAALGQLGRTEEAHVALQRALEVSPEAFLGYVEKRPLWYRPEDYDHMLEGLRKAGWQG